jgi:hypothetical protein
MTDFFKRISSLPMNIDAQAPFFLQTERKIIPPSVINISLSSPPDHLSVPSVPPKCIDHQRLTALSLNPASQLHLFSENHGRLRMKSLFWIGLIIIILVCINWLNDGFAQVSPDQINAYKEYLKLKKQKQAAGGV